ncbi:MAG TPA: helix-turn-helix domain-containing protein [Telluria sp.]|nr:helix-turn-helix domain-containing protein [Telluria sp.]
MSTESENPSAPAGANLPGSELKAKREALGLSVEQVADQLKMTPRQVAAIEAGDYASLPPSAVVRGFVRAYAKVLKMDADPLVAHVPVDVAAAAADTAAGLRRARPATFSEARFPSHGKRSSFPVLPVAAAVVVVVALAAAWFFGLFPARQPAAPADVVTPSANQVLPPATTTPAPSAPAAAGTEGTAVPTANVPLVTVPADAGAPAPADGTQPGTAPATPPTTAPAAPAANGAQGGAGAASTQTPPAPATKGTQGAVPAPVQNSAAPAAAATPANALVLNVKQDSWIEVRPGQGKPLVARLVKAGSTETVNISEPVTLVVGNPAGVDATLRGAPVDLPPLKGGTISRVNLK